MTVCCIIVIYLDFDFLWLIRSWVEQNTEAEDLRLKLRFIFQQNHNTKVLVKSRFRLQHIEVLEWPSQEKNEQNKFNHV